MRLLGFTAQKPLYRAWQADATLVERWRAEEYPELQREAKRTKGVNPSTSPENTTVWLTK
jgi:hypothetical protein